MMGYYCSRWMERLRTTDIAPDGETAEEIWTRFRCDELLASQTVYINVEGGIEDTGDTFDERCENHGDTDVRWSDNCILNAYEDLINAGYLTCPTCAASAARREDTPLYSGDVTLAEHHEAEHGIQMPPIFEEPVQRQAFPLDEAWYTDIELPADEIARMNQHFINVQGVPNPWGRYIGGIYNPDTNEWMLYRSAASMNTPPNPPQTFFRFLRLPPRPPVNSTTRMWRAD